MLHPFASAYVPTFQALQLRVANHYFSSQSVSSTELDSFKRRFEDTEREISSALLVNLRRIALSAMLRSPLTVGCAHVPMNIY
jgi:hypothetical protein